MKKILFIALSIFLSYQTYYLLQDINAFHSISYITTFLLAWIFNLYITGIFAFLGFALPTQQLLPNAYYRVAKPKRLQWIYSTFKVAYFRLFLLATFWRNKKQQKKYFNGKYKGLAYFILQTKKSEFGHLIPFILISCLCLYFLIKGLFLLSFLTFVVNCLGNWYPIILQRHHRMRIQKIYERKLLR